MFSTFSQAQAYQTSSKPPGNPLVQPIAEARLQQAQYFQALNVDIPAVPRTEDFAIDGPHGEIPVRLVHGSTDAAAPCIIFLRGAGFWAGSIDSHSRTIHLLALLTGSVVCAIDYRRAPEHSYPVQQQEVLCVYHWLRTRGGMDDRRWGMFGESAGATLALSAALTLRQTGDRLPSGLVLFYPNSSGPRPNARPYSRWVWKNYLGGADSRAVPGPVPLYQDLHGLPPVWLGCGLDDPLLVDTDELARRLAAANVPCEVVEFPGMPHAFVMYSATLQPAQDALQAAAMALRRFLT